MNWKSSLATLASVAGAAFMLYAIFCTGLEAGNMTLREMLLTNAAGCYALASLIRSCKETTHVDRI